MVIFGGGRNVAGPKYEYGEADDGALNAEVGKHLRSFLPDWFGGHWGREKDVDIEQEWSGIMAFTKSEHWTCDPTVPLMAKRVEQITIHSLDRHLDRMARCLKASSSPPDTRGTEFLELSRGESDRFPSSQTLILLLFAAPRPLPRWASHILEERSGRLQNGFRCIISHNMSKTHNLHA